MRFPVPVLVRAAQELVQRTCTSPVTVRDEHGNYRAVRCGSRLKEKCPGCANLVHGDYQAIFRSGVFSAAPTDRFLLLTLTAPSFGATHHVPKRKADQRPCRCGSIHDPSADGDIRGVPIDPTTYAYARQVDFNATVGRLWNATRSALRYHLPGMEYAGAYEDQARGAVHLHVLLRLPGREFVPATRDLVLQLVSQVATRSPDTGAQVRWGKQIDCQSVMPGADLGRSIWYLLKAVNYVTKEVADSGGGWSPRQAVHWRALRKAARQHRCSACRRNEEQQAPPLRYCPEHHPSGAIELHPEEGLDVVLLPSLEALDPRTGLLIDWATGEVRGDTAACDGCTTLRAAAFRAQTRCTGLLHRQNGRRSHTVVISRGYRGKGGWSLTGLSRTALKKQRAQWARAQFNPLSAKETAEQSLARAEDAVELRKLVDRYAVHGSANPVP